MSEGERYTLLAGRVLLSTIFILSALGKLADLGGTAAYMRAAGMPMVGFFLPMAILLELGGGLAILTGFAPRIGALALIVFIVPATLIFHAFWAASPADHQMQMIHFLKNLSILGGLLLVTPASAAAEH
jgi:putative oxidoreductase